MTMTETPGPPGLFASRISPYRRYERTGTPGPAGHLPRPNNCKTSYERASRGRRGCWGVHMAVWKRQRPQVAPEVPGSRKLSPLGDFAVTGHTVRLKKGFLPPKQPERYPHRYPGQGAEAKDPSDSGFRSREPLIRCQFHEKLAEIREPFHDTPGPLRQRRRSPRPSPPAQARRSAAPTRGPRGVSISAHRSPPPLAGGTHPGDRFYLGSTGAPVVDRRGDPVEAVGGAGSVGPAPMLRPPVVGRCSSVTSWSHGGAVAAPCPGRGRLATYRSPAPAKPTPRAVTLPETPRRRPTAPAGA